MSARYGAPYTWVVSVLLMGCGSDASPSAGGASVPAFGGGVAGAERGDSRAGESPAVLDPLEPAGPSDPMSPPDSPVVAPPESSALPVLAPTVPPAAGSGDSPSSEVGPEPAPPASGATPVALHGPLHVDGTRLVDASGTPVQLVGVSTMWLNWEDRYSTSVEGLRWMRDNWGVTVIRAAMGVEPTGAYLTQPERTLALLRQVVQNAIDVGVYVLIDWHDHNAHLHQDQAISFFSGVAREYGQFPNVIYETFNEPLNVSWSNVIKPYHEAVLRAIRAEDPDNVAILGTRSWSQRVDEAAQDPVLGTNLMYTVHFYACDHQDFQRRQAQAAYDAGLALFVTEWGATPADGGASERVVCEADAATWLDWLDERDIGWVAWKLDGCRDASCFFNSRNAPVNGGWDEQWLNGHARFVIDRLRE